MKQTIEITLSEHDVRTAIAEFVGRHDTNNKIAEMHFHIAVDGDYDKGTAREYVKEVVCVMVQERKAL